MTVSRETAGAGRREIAVTWRRIDELKPYARNSRTHSAAQIDQLATSIREFGWTNPLLVDAGGTVIAGHGRLEAAKALGLSEVPTIDVGHMSEEQRRAYVVADNALALQSGWDKDLLKLELNELRDAGFNMQLTGLATTDLRRLLKPIVSPRVGDEDAPADQAFGEEVIATRGDVWRLGANRLMCGDSTVEADVARLMGEDRAVLMATDPPYGVSHVATKDGIPRSGFEDMADRWEHIRNDDLQDDALQRFLATAFKAAANLALRDDAAWYLWHAHLTQGFFAAAAAADVLLHRQIIWEKPGFVLTRSGMYHWAHEPCFFGWRRGHQPPWYGEKNQRTVWPIGRDGDAIHPTQKPVALWEAPILNHSLPDEVCYEPFSGSGSQIIACQKFGRRCFAMELSERYVDAAIRRWQAYTGQQAKREGDGVLFDDLRAAKAA